jgi:hypothetical protein
MFRVRMTTQVLHFRVGSWALQANIRLGREGLSGQISLAYYEHSKIMDAKSYVTLAPSGLYYKTITIINDDRK